MNVQGTLNLINAARERGVRYIQVAGGNDIAWDTHGNTHDIRNLARNVDQGIAGLLRDLRTK